ncbi:MAG: FixH family protein [Verrucomicrobia bacterium]|nr:FixH family protein [Verrucomicrobiota bacterium]
MEGDVAAQRALAAAPWTAGKLVKKVGKQAVFFALSFLIGNTLLAYIIGSDALLRIITDSPAHHLVGLSFMLLFTLVFYLIFARFREQACTFICPYGRFQSTLVDENTIVVAYDHRRGERREHRHRGDTLEARRARGVGDCIDCRQCVAVCPTGIDIRNGTQMECVHCTACIDACDDIMDKVGRPRGLIRYASLNGIEKGEPLRLTPRILGYTAVLLALGGLLLFVLLSRSDVDTTLLRASGSLFQQTADGHISNLYILKIVNKTSRDLTVDLKLEDAQGGRLTVIGGPPRVPAQQLVQHSVLIELPPPASSAAAVNSSSTSTPGAGSSAAREPASWGLATTHAPADMEPSSPVPRPTLWPLGIVTAFALFMLGTAGLIVFSTFHREELVTADYYEQELRHQEQINRLERTEPLRDQVGVAYSPERQQLVISLPPQHAAPHPTGSIHLYRPSAARETATSTSTSTRSAARPSTPANSTPASGVCASVGPPKAATTPSTSASSSPPPQGSVNSIVLFRPPTRVRHSFLPGLRGKGPVWKKHNTID